MQLITVRAKRALTGDWGRAEPGDSINVPDYDAKELYRAGLIEGYLPEHGACIYENKMFVPGENKALPYRPGLPLVSCIMPTHDRRYFVTGAIDCFLKQTYPHKELIILDDGPSVEDLIPRNPCIRYIRNEGKLTIGAKRNLCCGAAYGDVIAHWDDDDWSAPGRLAEGVNVLMEHPEINVTGYSSMLFIDQRDGKAHRYVGAKNYVVGTSLMYRREFWLRHSFQELQIGEDGAFIKGVKTMPLEGYQMMVARTHTRNTAPKMNTARWKSVPVSELPEMA
jgi:hypothetical protein